MSLKDNMEPRIEELLPFYVLDALTGEEKELVESYLAEHPEARAQVQELQSGASALPYTVSPVEPPRQVKEALMKRVHADAKSRVVTSTPAVAVEPPRRGWRFDKLFQFFSMGAAVLAILWAFVLNSQVAQLQDEVSSLNQHVESQEQSIRQVVDQINRMENIVTVTVSGTDVQPGAQGQLIADFDKNSAVLLITGLPPLEPSRTYQVWLIEEGKSPSSAGLLAVDEHGQSFLILNADANIGSFQNLGISIEPEGGSPAPTGEIVVFSDI